MNRSLPLVVVLSALLLATRSWADPLAQGFDSPPQSARPQTFWHWMNGNVTPEGITLDLEAMARIGVSGVMIFDGSDYLPAGPANYLDPKWRALMTHAFKEGRRLGIQVGMHNGPGWSSSGGPWVKPAQSMQQLVWTETTVLGGQRLALELGRPQTNLGFYRDASVIAFPALPAERTPESEALASVRLGSRVIDAALLRDGRMETGFELAPDAPLILEYREPVELHGLTAFPGASRRMPRLTVEIADENGKFTTLTTVGAPARHGILAPAVRSFAAVKTRVVRITPAAKGELGELTLHRTPRIADWVAKANFDYRVTGQLAVPTATPPGAAIDPAQVVDLTSRLRGDRLEWDAPAGAWTILRIGHTSTGKTNVAASAAGRGLEIDKFNASATEFHFRSVVERVAAEAEAAGSPGPGFVIIDSYEAGMQNWTADFPHEFKRRLGYEITPYLPALFGRFVGDAGVAERFLADFRRVQADLMAERYYGRMQSLARDRGLPLYVEGYGTGNFDELRISGLSDVPLTEFWTRTPWTPNRVVKMVTSAAHVYGKRVVGAEAFTGEFRTSRWLEYPYALKILGDDVTAQGVNHFVFHRSVHQPHPTAAPGVSLGPYGFFFERTNTWFSQAKPWLDYLARTHWMLQQGVYAADVLYFTGDRSPDPSQFALPVLPRGYTYDLVNAEVILERLRVEGGDYVLPEGGRYKLLVLPPDARALRPEIVGKLREFVAAGGMLVGPKPRFAPTLAGYPESERRMLAQADELWDHPRVLANASIADALRRRGVTPAVTWAGPAADTDLSWQHRRLPDGDLFFLGNRQRRVEDVVVSFRDMGGRQPEIWRPESGERGDAVVFDAFENRARVPLRLEPGESLFVLFRRPATENAEAKVVTYDGAPLLSTEASVAPRVASAGDFTMALWVKPDTDLRAFPIEGTTGRLDETGKNYAIPADPGDLRFGPGHATAGLAVGRNGIFIVERARESSPAVLAWRGPVAGWTHVAVVYRQGTPHLYVNGELVRRGLRSGKAVRSGVGSPLPPVDYVLHFPAIESLTRAAGQPPPPSRGQVYFFEGNFVPPTEHPRALDDAEVKALAQAGLPPPPLPVLTGLRRTDGITRALAWVGGRYSVGGRVEQTVAVSPTRALEGAWHVAFESGRGAPEAIDLPELKSLHLHPEPGVKFFAGTARYSRQLDVPAAWLAADRRVVLDLGRVEVIAEVWINGKLAGSAWKEPYRVDITEAVRAGANALEVRVATLWPNRLIGDELLPPENEYGLRDEQGNDPHGIVKLPEWYRTGQPKPPGGRVAFSAWNFYSKDEPLVASGLLGPVRLMNPVQVEFR